MDDDRLTNKVDFFASKPRGQPWRTHGGLNGEIEKRLETAQKHEEPLVDFSVNLNYYGPSPRVQKALTRANPVSYPRPDYLHLKSKLQERHPVKHICVGNGAADLMWSCAQAFVARGACAVIVEPTFCEFRAGWTAALKTAREENPSQRLRSWVAREEDGFQVDLKALSKWLGEIKKPKIVYFCNPNSPTGRAVDPFALERMVEDLPETWLLLDEAFWTLCDHGPGGDERIPWDGRVTSSRVIHLRSMTKDHALAGIRLGYLAAAPEVVSWIEEHRPPWMLNAVAHEAALATLDEDAFVAESWRRIARDREQMIQELNQVGFRPLPTTTLFMALKVPCAAFFQRELLDHGLLVRSMESYGLPTYLRVCTRPLPEAQRLAQALVQVSQRWQSLSSQKSKETTTRAGEGTLTFNTIYHHGEHGQ